MYICVVITGYWYPDVVRTTSSDPRLTVLSSAGPAWHLFSFTYLIPAGKYP